MKQSMIDTGYENQGDRNFHTQVTWGGFVTFRKHLKTQKTQNQELENLFCHTDLRDLTDLSFGWQRNGLDNSKSRRYCRKSRNNYKVSQIAQKPLKSFG